ncbi:MAG: metalloregulator ArsR/SmtB family transcription factor [Candidatus Izemoplasma sp.]|nr:metalloregulator ArsR/SmtB family transcription factor [Candidatus Izemoplasma sp.]
MKEKIAKQFKVLSDPTRLEIIELLLKGETCGCTLIDNVDVSQPTLSYHLKMITEAGLATAERDGNWIKHYINKDALNTIIRFLEDLRDVEAEQCSL